MLPRVREEGIEGYTTEEQAASYPAGSYELALQIAAESGNQRDLDAVFQRRNSNETLPMAGYARRKMFELQELGAGAAAASTLFALIALFTAVYLVAARVRVEPEAT